jgi:plasmid stabilization system protein ParE
MTVKWRAEAIADVVRLVNYIAQKNPVAASSMGRELLLAGDSLDIFPRRGRIGRDPTTRELVTVRPYILVYEVDDEDNVTILNVWHAAQDWP